MKETMMRNLKSSLKEWECPSDGTFFRQLSCGESLLTWTLSVGETVLESRLTVEAPHPVVVPLSFGYTGIGWTAIGNSISAAVSWNLCGFTKPDLKARMGRILSMMGLAVSGDPHAYEEVLSQVLFL